MDEATQKKLKTLHEMAAKAETPEMKNRIARSISKLESQYHPETGEKLEGTPQADTPREEPASDDPADQYRAQVLEPLGVEVDKAEAESTAVEKAEQSALAEEVEKDKAWAPEFLGDYQAPVGAGLRNVAGLALHGLRGATGGGEEWMAQNPKKAAMLLGSLPGMGWIGLTEGLHSAGKAAGVVPEGIRSPARMLGEGMAATKEAVLPTETRRELEGQIPWWLSLPATITGAALLPTSPANIGTALGRLPVKAGAAKLLGPKTSELGLAGRDVLASATGGATGAATEGAIMNAAEGRDPTDNLGLNAVLGGLLGPVFDVLGAGAAKAVRGSRETAKMADPLQIAEDAGVTTKTFGGRGVTEPDWYKKRIEQVRDKQSAGAPVQVGAQAVAHEMSDELAGKFTRTAMDEQIASRQREMALDQEYFRSERGRRPVRLNKTIEEVQNLLQQGEMGPPRTAEEQLIEPGARQPIIDPSDPVARETVRNLMEVEAVPIGEPVPAGTRELVVSPDQARKLGFDPDDLLRRAQAARRGAPAPQSSEMSVRSAEILSEGPPSRDTFDDKPSFASESPDAVREPPIRRTLGSPGAQPPPSESALKEFRLVLRPKRLTAEDIEKNIAAARQRSLTPEGESKGHPLWDRVHRGLMKDREAGYPDLHRRKSATSEEIAHRQNRNEAAGLPRDIPTRRTPEGETVPDITDVQRMNAADIAMNYRRGNFQKNPKLVSEALLELANKAGAQFDEDIVGELNRLAGVVAREELAAGVDIAKPRVALTQSGVTNYAPLDPGAFRKRTDPLMRAFSQEGSDALKTLVDLLSGPAPTPTKQAGRVPAPPISFGLRGGHAGARTTTGLQAPAPEGGILGELPITPEGGQDGGQEEGRNPRAVLVDLIRAATAEGAQQ